MPPRPGSRNGFSSRSSTKLGSATGAGAGAAAFGGATGAAASDFGASAPIADVYRHFGLTADRVAEVATGLAKGA